MIHEVVLKFNSANGAILNVLHYDIDVPTDEVKQLFADYVGANFSTTFRDRVVNTVSFEGLVIREDQPGAVGVLYQPPLAPLAGTAPNANYVAQLAMLVRKRTLGTTKPNVGRIFVGGLHIGFVEGDSKWMSVVRNEVADFWNNMVDIELSSGNRLYMVLKKSATAANPTAGYNDVRAIEVVDLVATQRRRKRGVGS